MAGFEEGKMLSPGFEKLDIGEDYVMVVAIDFGTAYSGYAFSFKSSPDEIRCNREWGNEIGMKSYKTPTCVLTNKNDEFESFGYDALQLYTRDLDAEKSYEFYDRFKMSLYKEKVISSRTTIISRGGRSQPAEIIIAMCLRYMKKHVLTAFENAEVGKVDSSQIRWVLTVPAIWSDGSKQMMRRAAYKAGIIDNPLSKKLLIALEPEVASFWCRSLPLNEYQDANVTKTSMPDGTIYMIVDCGGGTIDIAVHQMLHGGKIKEVYRANGGDWGGVKVDEEFLKVMDKIFTKRFTDIYKTKFPRDWLNILLHFETMKRGYAPTNGKSMNIQLSYNLGEAVEEELGKSLRKTIIDAELEGVSFTQGMLVLNPNRIKMIFQPAVSKIVEHMANLLKKPMVKSTKYIFLVGGFSESKMLSTEIRNTFGRKQTVMIPQDASVAVMKGAAIFGHNPSRVVSRIARKTYGISTTVPFNPNKHDSIRKELIDGEPYVKDVFAKWLTKGEIIEVGTSKQFIYYPYSKDCMNVNIMVYYTELDNVVYVTEEGIERGGALVLDTPDKHLSRDERKVQVNVFFGETELYIRVQDLAKDCGDTKEMFVDFLSE